MQGPYAAKEKEDWRRRFRKLRGALSDRHDYTLAEDKEAYLRKPSPRATRSELYSKNTGKKRMRRMAPKSSANKRPAAARGSAPIAGRPRVGGVSDCLRETRKGVGAVAEGAGAAIRYREVETPRE